MSTKKSMLLGGGLALAVLGAMVLVMRPSSPKSAALASREKALEALGACIARFRPQCKVLVLSNPFTESSGYLNEKSRFDRASIRGLRKGLGRNIPVEVVFPEIRGEYFTNRQALILPPDCQTPLSFAIEAASVDRLADAHPGFEVIVSLIGLPVGVDQLKIWSDLDPRCFALLQPDLRVLGPPSQAIEGFRRGKLLAAVAQDVESGDPLLITRDNLEAVLENQPKALGY